MKYTVSPLIGFTLIGTGKPLYVSRSFIVGITEAQGTKTPATALMLSPGDDDGITWIVNGSIDEIRTVIDNHADHWWGE